MATLRSLLLLFFLFATVPGFSQEPTKLMSLKEAIFLALRYNPDVQIEEIQRVVDKFNLRVAQNEFELRYALTGSIMQSATRFSGNSSSSRSSTFTPELSLNGKYGTRYRLRMNNPITQSSGAPGTYNPGIDLEINQPLIRGFGKEVTLAPLYDATDREIITQLQFKDILMRTVANIITDYRAIIQSQNNVETSLLALKSYQQTKEMVEAQIKAGRKAPSDVLQAESNYANQLVTLQNTTNQVLNNKLNLLNEIGLIPSTHFLVPNDVDDIELEVPKLEKCYTTALEHNIAYQRSLIDLRVAERTLYVAQDNTRISLDMALRASTGNSSGTSPNSGLESLTNKKNTNLSVALTLDVPIDNFSLKQQLLDAKIALEQQQINLAAQKRELRTTIKNDIIDVSYKAEQIKLAKKALELQKNTQQALTARLRHGVVSTFEVTQTQQDLNRSRESLISSKIEYLNALTKLYLDMGVLLEKWQITLIY